MLNNRQLTQRLLIALALTLAIAASLAAVLWLRQFRNLTLQDNAIDQQRIMQKTSQQIGQIAREVSLALNISDAVIGSHPRLDPRHDPLLQVVASQFHDASRGLIDLRLLDEHNQILFPRHGLRGPLVPGAPEDFFARLRQHPPGNDTFSNPVFNSDNQQWSVIAARRLQHRQAGVDIVYAAFDMRSMTETLGLTAPSPGMAIQLTGIDGTVLAHWPATAGLIGKNINRSPLMQAARQMQSGTLRTTMENGDERVMSFMHHPRYSLIISVDGPVQDIEQPIRAEERRVILAVLIFIATELSAIGVVSLLLGRLHQRHQNLELELVDKIEHVTALDRHAAQLESTKIALERLSQTDPLTGVYNRRRFTDVLERWLGNLRPATRSLCLVYLDIDHFKAINDRHGHNVGDVVLQTLAQMLQKQLRPADMVARLGGEEFGLLLPQTNPQQAAIIVERIHQTIQAQAFDSEQGPFHISFSAGIAEAQSDDTAISLMARADGALYQAKEQGRSRVLIAR